MSALVIYSICLAVGLLFTVISLLFSHFFDGGDGHPDIGTGGHAESGFDGSGVPGVSFFSPTVLASFITAFGAFGVIFTRVEATSSIWVSAPLSALGGLAVAFAAFSLFNAMFRKTQSSSESHVSSLVGQCATIVSPIPENGVGEIAYVQGSTRYTAPARTESGVPIAAGKPVRISRVVGTQFYVEPMK
jgi:membrane protein implicated in regulation of membrane protease activity